MFVAIVGSRDLGQCDCPSGSLHWPPTPDEKVHQEECQKVQAWLEMLKIITKLGRNRDFEGIVTGGADGADTLAASAAETLGVKCIVYPVRAGPEPFAWRAKARNQKVVNKASQLIAVFRPGSITPGTRDAIEKAQDKGIPVHILHRGKWHTSLEDVL